MKTYLGENPDSSEAIKFLCLAEGGEVTHYEALNTMAQGIKNMHRCSTINIRRRDM